LERFVSLPGPSRTRKRRPRRESFELSLADGHIIRVDGWIPDRRYAQDVRVKLPDGRTLQIEGFRYGWFVCLDDDLDNLAGGELTGCIAGVLGWWGQTAPDEWPEWVWALERKLDARDRGREKSSP